MTDDLTPDPPQLHGADYRAVHRLSTGDDETLAEIGQTCERVPPVSLPWLLADGLIEPVQPPPRRRETDPRDESEAPDGR